MPSTVPEMSSPGAGAVAKGSGAGTYWLAGTSRFSRVNVLVVANGPAGVRGPVEKLAYCCPVDAGNDQEDGTAGAEAREGGAVTTAGAGPDEAAVNGTGARRRRTGATARGFSPCDSNNNSSPSSVTLW